MAHSSQAAGKIVAFARAVQERGITEASREFGIDDLFGRPIDDALPLLTEIFCEPGGGVDEGITNRAWSDTLLTILEQGIIDLNAINDPQQWISIIETFIVESICHRINNDIGNKTLKVAQDVLSINRMSRQVRDIVEGSVAGTIPPLLAGDGRHQERVLQEEINNIYQLAFGFLEALNAEE